MGSFNTCLQFYHFNEDYKTAHLVGYITLYTNYKLNNVDCDINSIIKCI